MSPAHQAGSEGGHPTVDQAADPLSDCTAEIVRLTGLRVQSGNRARLESHVHARLQRLGLHRPEELLQRLRPGSDSAAEERRLLAELLTTGETFFMRDRGQMQLLQGHLLPRLIEERRGERRLAIWSSACSTGEETYSLAILLHALLPDRHDWDLRLIGSDVNASALERARAGVYGEWSLRGSDAAFRQRHFTRHGWQWRLREPIRRMARFTRQDLLQADLVAADPNLSGLDLILCRNFLIYLAPPAVAAVVERLTACLRDGGLLLFGHAELGAHRPAGLRAEMYPQSVVYRKAPPLPSHPASLAPSPSSGRSSGPRSGRSPGQSLSRHPMHAPTGTRDQSRSRPASAAPSRLPPSGPLQPVSGRTRTAQPREPLQSAWVDANAGRHARALQTCRRLVEREPTQAEAHLLIGLVALELGRNHEARAALRKAIYLEPDSIAAHVHLEALQRQSAEPLAARRTRARLRQLLSHLPPDSPVPLLGDTRVLDLQARLSQFDAEPCPTT